jgi:hypothetical protein
MRLINTAMPGHRTISWKTLCTIRINGLPVNSARFKTMPISKTGTKNLSQYCERETLPDGEK